VSTDWAAWHARYADPDSALSRRLRVVQEHIGAWLDATAPAPVTVLSICAGDGRDLLEVLSGRTDDGRVRATLLEADAGLAGRAAAVAREAGLAGCTVRHADASRTDAYVGAAPADLVLLCGVLGNISDDDAARTVAALPQLCAPGATVVWTRHRREPDLTPAVRRWFAQAGLDELSFTAPADAAWSVGLHRFVGRPQSLVAGRRLFTFVR
jgi:hypothetical protein